MRPLLNLFAGLLIGLMIGSSLIFVLGIRSAAPKQGIAVGPTSLDWPSWVQAVGSVAAIFAAITIASWQNRIIRLKTDEQKQTLHITALEHMKEAYQTIKLIGNALSAKALVPEGLPIIPKQIFNIHESMGRFPVYSLGGVVAARAFLHCRATVLIIALEAELFSNNGNLDSNFNGRFSGLENDLGGFVKVMNKLWPGLVDETLEEFETDNTLFEQKSQAGTFWTRLDKLPQALTKPAQGTYNLPPLGSKQR